MTRPMSALTECLAEVIRPLQGSEERRAVEAALGRLDLHRPVVYGAELLIAKRRGELPDRRVSVLLADLDGYVVHEAIVDDEGEVVDLSVCDDLVPPFSAAEIAEATVLAGSHPGPAAAMRGWKVVPAPFYPADEHTAGPGRGRLVGLHYLDMNDPAAVRPVASVVVDLTRREVCRFDDHEHYDGNDDADDRRRPGAGRSK